MADLLEQTDEPAGDSPMVWMTGTEWRLAVRRALAEIGCTYAELEQMARSCAWPSWRHRSLWIIIGSAGGEEGERGCLSSRRCAGCVETVCRIWM